MCGICGIATRDPQERVDALTIERMRDTLLHRGPDDCGCYVAPGIGLGHRRLSIIDLGPEGRQPMGNEDGTVQIVFNGEIYNFAEHRKRLIDLGHRFVSRTDSEVIVHLYEELGVQCLSRLRGMFAFAIWDERKRMLFLARDRLGKKPLFYSFDGSRLIFGSEPKAILAWPGFKAEPDLEAIDNYITLGYVPSPASAFKGIRKLPPAHYLLFHDGKTDLQRYWQLHHLPKLEIGYRDACDEIIRRLTEAVKLRLISDVPLGAFLSGGVDSSAVVAIMSQLSSKPVKTFTIGFKERDYDESSYAREIAERFGTEHHEFIVEPNLEDILERLVWHYNEPYADSSAIPTYFLSKLTREHVKVALNGDGSDENFAGYYRHTNYLRSSYRRKSAGLLRRITSRVLSRTHRLIRPAFRTANPQRVLSHIPSLVPELRYAELLSVFDSRHRQNLYSDEFASSLGRPEEEVICKLYREADSDNDLDSALYVDANLYLPDDLLVKVDVASMAWSLEARSPMVDHEFMEFAARLPARFKASGLNRKIVFRTALKGLLPKSILNRRKMGFSVPLEHWFRGEMSGLVRDTLLGKSFLERGYFKESYVRTLVDEHLRGACNWHNQLWSLVMLELWHRVYIDSASSDPTVAH
jgi:asparagine synthase (glutamine-hydrolysing)